MTVHTALLQGASLLEDAGIAVARLTAEVLLSHAIGCERVYLYAHPEQDRGLTIREAARRRFSTSTMRSVMATAHNSPIVSGWTC